MNDSEELKTRLKALNTSMFINTLKDKVTAIYKALVYEIEDVKSDACQLCHYLEMYKRHKNHAAAIGFDADVMEEFVEISTYAALDGDKRALSVHPRPYLTWIHIIVNRGFFKAAAFLMPLAKTYLHHKERGTKMLRDLIKYSMTKKQVNANKVLLLMDYYKSTNVYLSENIHLYLNAALEAEDPTQLAAIDAILTRLQLEQK